MLSELLRLIDDEQRNGEDPQVVFFDHNLGAELDIYRVTRTDGKIVLEA